MDVKTDDETLLLNIDETLPTYSIANTVPLFFVNSIKATKTLLDTKFHDNNYCRKANTAPHLSFKASILHKDHTSTQDSIEKEYFRGHSFITNHSVQGIKDMLLDLVKVERAQSSQTQLLNLLLF